MEITPENAFYTSIKLSIHPFQGIYTSVSGKAQQKICSIIDYLLQKPVQMTFLALIAIIFMISTITISFTFVVGTTFLVVILIMLESFMLATAFLIMLNTTFIIIFVAFMSTHIIKF